VNGKGLVLSEIHIKTSKEEIIVSVTAYSDTKVKVANPNIGILIINVNMT